MTNREEGSLDRAGISQRLTRLPCRNGGIAPTKMKAERVLITNLKSLPAWHLDLAAAFEAAGIETEVYLTTPQSLAERFEKSVRGRKWFESGASHRRLLEQCRRLKPQVILFLGMFVLPRATVEAIRSLATQPLLCGWVCDCFRESQFAEYEPADHVFYFDTFLETILPNYYADSSRMSYLPLAANPDRYLPRDSVDRNDALLFVGNVSANRQALLDALPSSIDVAIHGPNAADRRGDRRRKLDSAEINELYNAHQVTLNINQSPNTEHGANLRVFEATAAGTTLLTQACDDLTALYEPDSELVTWSNVDELAAGYARLRDDRALAARIAEAGRKRTLAEHTFRHRADSMMTVWNAC